MPSKWIGRIRKAQVGKRWSSREKAHRYNPENMSYHAGSPEYDMRVHVEFSTKPTNEDLPSCVRPPSLPLVSTGAR